MLLSCGLAAKHVELHMKYTKYCNTRTTCQHDSTAVSFSYLIPQPIPDYIPVSMHLFIKLISIGSVPPCSCWWWGLWGKWGPAGSWGRASWPLTSLQGLDETEFCGRGGRLGRREGKQVCSH